MNEIEVTLLLVGMAIMIVGVGWLLSRFFMRLD